MAETARKRFDISEKSSTKRRVGKTDFRTDCTKRALNVVRIDKQNTGLIHVTNLFPYFLIPLFPLSERRLTHQFGTYTDAGLDAAKRQYAQNPCPIRLSAGGGGLNPLHSTLSGRRSPLLHSGQTLKNNNHLQVILNSFQDLQQNTTQAKNL